MLDQFEKLGDINATFARYADQAPAVKQAEAKLEAAKRDLAQAELDLRYCDIIAEDRRRRHAAQRQSGQLCSGRPKPDGNSLTQRNLG